MTDKIWGQAAYNNALWCDAVCSTHQRRGEFHATLWLARHGAPRFYPDAVTLAGSEAASAQLEAISAFIREPRRAGWAIKDSFQCLDLHHLGFEPLFDAEWIGAMAPVTDVEHAAANLHWTQVGDDADLLRWEQAWRTANVDAVQPRMFMPGLLADPDIRFVRALKDGLPVGGGILNRGAGVVGISNLFATALDLDVLWCGLARCAVEAFPDQPLVAYDRGDALAAARGVGFSTIGHLRVWQRPAMAQSTP